VLLEDQGIVAMEYVVLVYYYLMYLVVMILVDLYEFDYFEGVLDFDCLVLVQQNMMPAVVVFLVIEV